MGCTSSISVKTDKNGPGAAVKQNVKHATSNGLHKSDRDGGDTKQRHTERVSHEIHYGKSSENLFQATVYFSHEEKEFAFSKKPSVSTPLYTDQTFSVQQAFESSSLPENFSWIRTSELDLNSLQASSSNQHHTVSQVAHYIHVVLEVVKSRPWLTAKIFPDDLYINGTSKTNGLCHCRLHLLGRWTDVYFDNYVRYTSVDQKRSDIQIHDLLVEKALARVWGSYQELDKASFVDVLNALSGGHCKNLEVQTTSENVLINLLTNGVSAEDVLCTLQENETEKTEMTLLKNFNQTKDGSLVTLQRYNQINLGENELDLKFSEFVHRVKEVLVLTLPNESGMLKPNYQSKQVFTTDVYDNLRPCVEDEYKYSFYSLEIPQKTSMTIITSCFDDCSIGEVTNTDLMKVEYEDSNRCILGKISAKTNYFSIEAGHLVLKVMHRKCKLFLRCISDAPTKTLGKLPGNKMLCNFKIQKDPDLDLPTLTPNIYAIHGRFENGRNLGGRFGYSNFEQNPQLKILINQKTFARFSLTQAITTDEKQYLGLKMLQVQDEDGVPITSDRIAHKLKSYDLDFVKYSVNNEDETFETDLTMDYVFRPGCYVAAVHLLSDEMCKPDVAFSLLVKSHKPLDFRKCNF